MRTIIEMQNEKRTIDEFVTMLINGVDYGIIEGFNLPTLLLPGAQKLRTFFELRAISKLIEKIEKWGEDGTEPLFYYRYNTEVFDKNNVMLSSADGICSSREMKYRFKISTRVCPACGAAAIKTDKNQKYFYCWAKKSGCGKTFKIDDPLITEQKITKEINPDIYDGMNTFLQMAKKRSFVPAIIYACDLSGRFTYAERIDQQKIPANKLPQAETTQPPPATTLPPTQKQADKKQFSPAAPVLDGEPPMPGDSPSLPQNGKVEISLARLENTQKWFAQENASAFFNEALKKFNKPLNALSAPEREKLFTSLTESYNAIQKTKNKKTDYKTLILDVKRNLDVIVKSSEAFSCYFYTNRDIFLAKKLTDKYLGILGNLGVTTPDELKEADRKNFIIEIEQLKKEM